MAATPVTLPNPQIKRHQTGQALVIGTAPLIFGSGGLKPGELVHDEVGKILYAAVGADASGNSTGIVAIGGSGAFASVGAIPTSIDGGVI